MGAHYEDWLNKQIDELTVNKKQLEVAYKELEEKYNRIQCLVSTVLFDKGAFPFICGTMGESDKNGMFEYFSICPAFGSDATYTYKKVTENGT